MLNNSSMSNLHTLSYSQRIRIVLRSLARGERTNLSYHFFYNFHFVDNIAKNITVST